MSQQKPLQIVVLNKCLTCFYYCIIVYNYYTESIVVNVYIRQIKTEFLVRIKLLKKLFHELSCKSARIYLDNQQTEHEFQSTTILFLDDTIRHQFFFAITIITTYLLEYPLNYPCLMFTWCVSIGVSVGLNTRFALRLQAYANTSSIPVQFHRRTRRQPQNIKCCIS